MRTAMAALVAAGLFFFAGQVQAEDATRRALAEQLLNEMNMKATVEKSMSIVKKMIPRKSTR